MTTDARQPESDQTASRVVGPSAEPALQPRPFEGATTNLGVGEPVQGLTMASNADEPLARGSPQSTMAAPRNMAPPDPLPLLATKLYMPPPRRDLVRRPRLTARLSAGLRAPLTLLVAPAGSGKTTVLADWCAAEQESAEGTPWPVAWLALDHGDNDLVRFLRYIIAALRPLRAEIGRGVLSSLGSPQPSYDALLTLLINDLMTLPGDVVLVLDDYHVIADPAVHRALTFLLDHLPPRVHLVIATRVDPPLPLARLRARGQLIELRIADLRFTTAETTAFLHQTMDVRLSVDDMALLEACTEGWIAGLQLAALALHGRDPTHLRTTLAERMGAHRYIIDYLADEVFDRQPAEVQDFLLRTSVLDRLSGPLCDALTAETSRDQAAADGQAMLERLDAANLFLVPLDDTRTWYRYHHLFAGFLRERLRRQRSDLIAGLHRRAYAWLEQHGLAAQAADHALAAGDYAQAAQLIEQVIAPTIWQRGELATLQRWLDQLPRAVTRARPRLCLDLAWALLWSAQFDAVEPRLGDAEQALDILDTPGTPDTPDAVAAEAGQRAGPRGDGHALRGEIAALRAELARQRGEIGSAITLARRALADLPAGDRRVRGVTAGLLAGAYLAGGDASAASQAYAEAASVSLTPETITLALIAGGRLVFTQALQGRLHEAAQTYQQTFDVAAASHMLETPSLGVAQVGMAEVLRERNDLSAAEELVRRGIGRCLESAGLAEMALDGYLTLARVLQARGDHKGALAALRQAEIHGGAYHVLRSAERVAAARARLWLTSTPGDVAAAGRWAVAWLEQEQRRAEADESLDYVGVLGRLTLARWYVVQRRREEAAALLRRLLARAEAGGLTGAALEILTLQARIEQEQDRMAPALLALGRALALAEPAGYVRVFVDEGAPMVALLRQAQARGAAPAYLATLLAACSDEGQGQAASPAAATLVDPLSARELELLRLLAAGLSTHEIAAQLFITAGTARNHLKSIYGKLDVHSRLQAVERARTLGLL